MDLSIAMIVKDEEKNLERCLKAVEYLKGKITYEVIIVDTGSTDNTINIAKNYTDRVYEHQWSGDFGEMRNISIKYSKGDWILILDADEVLDNPEELVSFLKSKESKKYNAAEINFKNLLSDDVNNYILATLFRLFKNLKDFYYVGRIHEQPRVIVPYTKSKVTVLHYGYSREDYEVMRYKYERNKELLLKDLANNKEPIYTRFQLAQTYSMANYHYEAFETIKEAYELDRKRKDGKNNINVYHFYSRELLSRGEYEKAIKVCNQIFDYFKDSLDCYYVLANSYIKLKEYVKAEENYNKYFNLYKKKSAGSVENGLLEGGSIVDYSYVRKNEMITNYLLCFYESKNYNRLIEEYEKLEDEVIIKETEQIYIYSLTYQQNYAKVINHYKKEVTDRDIENIINVIAQVNINNENISIKDMAKKLLGINEILDIYIKEIYLNKEVEFDYNDFNFKDLYIWKTTLLKKILFRNKYILENIKILDKSIIDRYICSIIDNYDCLKVLYDYSEDKFMTRNIRELVFVNIIEKRLLFNRSIDNTKFKSLVKRAKFNTISFVNFTYKDDIANHEDLFFILDKYERLWVRISYLIKYKTTDIVEYIRGFKNTLEDMIEYKKILDRYISEFKTEPVSEEMVKEKDELLSLVEGFISENRYNEALEILDQLSNIFMYDKNILLYRGVTLFLLKRNKEALIDLSEAYLITDDKFDVTYNIACILEAEGNMEIANYYYKEALSECKDEELKLQIREIIGE